MRGCVEQRCDRIVIGVHPVSDRMHQAGSIWLGKDNPVAARRAQFHHCIPQTGWICIPVALNLVRLNGSIHVGLVLDARARRITGHDHLAGGRSAPSERLLGVVRHCDEDTARG